MTCVCADRALSDEEVEQRLEEFSSPERTFLFEAVDGIVLYTHRKEQVLLSSLYAASEEGERTILMFGRNLL